MTPTVSLWLGGADGATLASREADAAHPAASLVKLPLAVAAHRAHEAGLLDLDAPVLVHDDLASAVPGARFAPERADDQEDLTWRERGGRTPLRTLVSRAVSLSSNLASALVLEHVGPVALEQVLRDAGCSATTRVGLAIGDAPARAAGRANVLTAADVGLVLAALGGARLAGPAATAAVLADLDAQVHRGGIAAGLPSGLGVASKSGWFDGVTHDAALVRPAGHPPVVLVVLTGHDLDRTGGDALVARLAARAWTDLERRVGRPLRGAA